jgi:hypothetical protein
VEKDFSVRKLLKDLETVPLQSQIHRIALILDDVYSQLDSLGRQCEDSRRTDD